MTVAGNPHENLFAAQDVKRLVHRPCRYAFRHGGNRRLGLGRIAKVLAHQHDRRLEQSGGHLLALARLFSFAQRQQHRDQGEHAARDIDHGGPGPQWPAGGAGHVGQSRHHLDHLVQRLAFPVGAIQKALQAGVDEPRIGPAERLVAQVQALHRIGREILHQHVRRLDQLQQDRASALVLQVNGNAALVAVEIAEVAGPEPLQASRSVAFHGFDLDHVGAQVRQHHAAGRAHHRVPEIKHANTRERQLPFIRHVHSPSRAGTDRHSCKAPTEASAP
ncbi:hypothetical protein D3C85_1028070 [compost metagenome]